MLVYFVCMYVRVAISPGIVLIRQELHMFSQAMSPYVFGASFDYALGGSDFAIAWCMVKNEEK